MNYAVILTCWFSVSMFFCRFVKKYRTNNFIEIGRLATDNALKQLVKNSRSLSTRRLKSVLAEKKIQIAVNLVSFIKFLSDDRCAVDVSCVCRLRLSWNVHRFSQFCV